MGKRKFPLVDTRQRNIDIIRMRNEGKPYKVIARELNCTTHVVTAVLKKLRLALRTDPVEYNSYTYILDRAKPLGQKGGRVSELCAVLGIDAVKWVWKNRVEDLNFAENIGLIVKDAYLEATDDKVRSDGGGVDG